MYVTTALYLRWQGRSSAEKDRVQHTTGWRAILQPVVCCYCAYSMALFCVSSINNAPKVHHPVARRGYGNRTTRHGCKKSIPYPKTHKTGPCEPVLCKTKNLDVLRSSGMSPFYHSLIKTEKASVSQPVRDSLEHPVVASRMLACSIVADETRNKHRFMVFPLWHFCDHPSRNRS